ncbi:MAG: SIR2 family protein [Thermoproteota archaeon]|nr:SIR2 family protein [Acidobacteriota bacterium]MDQ3902790.1 SIR2 family protein [Thermoproteota archaeon]
MTLKRQQLVSNYVSAMHEGDAALFIGAGMSRPAGFVDWRGLLRDCAQELNLDIDREHDLVAVAQYYLNRRSKDRSRLNQILKNEFDRPGTFSENHKIIGQLPISTVWTTNFDSLLEKAFWTGGKIVDVKSRDKNLAMPTKGRQVVLYKMHGDIAMPDEAIICKDDYERYATKHPLIQNQLEADLINKTFLFLGFSFTDPHLDYMLSHLRTLLEENKREHYAVMRRVRFNKHNRKKHEAQRTFEYETNKQALQIEDLQRYSIHTHLIDQYSEVTEILETIEQHYYRKNILVSGSAHEFGQFGEDKMRNLCMQLGRRLMEREYKLVSGFGLNVGDSVVHGAVLELYGRGKSVLEKHLLLRPFPRNLPSGIDEEEFNKKYREDMISNCGFAIFIAGTSRTNQESKGVLEEYKITRKLKKIPIPIGATGFAARRIWEMVKPDVKDIYSGAVSLRLFQRLNDPKLSNEQLLDVIFEIINEVSAI